MSTETKSPIRTTGSLTAQTLHTEVVPQTRTTGRLNPAGSAPPPAPSSARRIALILGGALLLLLLLVAGILPRMRREATLTRAATEKQAALPVVRLVTPQAASGDNELALPGTAQALQEAVVAARANGYVRRWLADIGARVQQGQLLAEIDAPELDLQLRQAQQETAEAGQRLDQSKQELAQTQAAIEQAEAALRQSKTQLELARLELERSKTLVRKGVVSQQETDQLQAAYDARLADVAAAEANVRVRQASSKAQQSDIASRQSSSGARQSNQERIAELLSFKRVTAPFSGVITARNVDIGSLISPAGGTASANGLFKIARVDTLRTFVNVPQTYATAMRLGMAATVEFKELPQQTFTGKVAHTAGALDAATRTLPVEVQIPNARQLLLPGMYATVKFKLATPVNVVRIPASALVVRPEGQFVFTVNEQQIARLQKVELGRDFGKEIEVVSGLAGREQIIAVPIDAVRDGGKIEAQKAKVTQ